MQLKTEKPIIFLDNIQFGYPGGKTIFNQVNFKFHQGDRMGLIAANGSGKTTFFHIIMGLIRPVSGTIQIFGKPAATAKDFEDARRRIGLLFQDPDDQLFCPTVIEDVAFGPLNLGKSKKEALQIAQGKLADLGLEDLEDRITFMLSGGEKRLVSLAAVLAMEPEVLLLDEPLTGLDVETRSNIEKIITNLKQSLIIISHDIDFLWSVTSRICTIKNGNLIDEDEAQLHVHRHLHPHSRYPHEHS